MKTEVIQLDRDAPDAKALAHAGEILRRGGLVAFPTETVYGLGANALDANAVAKIFEAKARPDTNPVIVHVAAAVDVRTLVSDWPAAAEQLANAFWPGPLSLVCRKSAAVPDVVTAGGATVAVRMPSHPIAYGLIAAAGVPLAAPSANRSTGISSTLAEHVLNDLDGRIDLVLDGGTTDGGMESTVVDCSVEPPMLLRPGPIALSQLERAAGRAFGSRSVSLDDPARSPGLQERHYAPRARLECLAADAGARVAVLGALGERVGWLSFDHEFIVPRGAVRIVMPREPVEYAHRLYAALHELDEAGVSHIVVETPPEGEAWTAIHDRLRRASA